jgi:8-oxo-dGTP pyrophosphatase MutT (NUDIX family)
MGVGRFLGLVGALIWSPKLHKYLILKRSQDKDFESGVWECGTGRVDQGENFSQALRREMWEELGVDIQIEFIIGTTHFYRGEKIPANEMIGIFYYCSIDDPEKIKVSWEHSEYRWVTYEDAKALLTEGHWLVRLINRAEVIRSLIPEKLIDYHREMGFDI